MTKDYFTGLIKWLAIAGAAAESPYVIYGGSESQKRSGIEVLPWEDIVKLSEIC
ncbi:MAG: hypothetical protein IT392_12445 [Nitrospirae bacterium]|nr:hypothetical protein [Nitrospirota bacterium]MCC6545285.1 hypothetical protein [Nitrospirota bacterium]